MFFEEFLGFLQKRNWLEKIGGIEGLLQIFKDHIVNLTALSGEFHNLRCLENVIKIEYQRWIEGKQKSENALKNKFSKSKGNFTIDDWIFCLRILWIER